MRMKKIKLYAFLLISTVYATEISHAQEAGTGAAMEKPLKGILKEPGAAPKGPKKTVRFNDVTVRTIDTAGEQADSKEEMGPEDGRTDFTGEDRANRRPNAAEKKAAKKAEINDANKKWALEMQITLNAIVEAFSKAPAAEKSEIAAKFMKYYNQTVDDTYRTVDTPGQVKVFNAQSQIKSVRESLQLLNSLTNKKLLNSLANKKEIEKLKVIFCDMCAKDGSAGSMTVVERSSDNKPLTTLPPSFSMERIKLKIIKSLPAVNTQERQKQLMQLISIFEEFKAAPPEENPLKEGTNFAIEFMNLYNGLAIQQKPISSPMEALTLLKDMKSSRATIDSMTLGKKTYIVKNVGGKKTSLTPTVKTRADASTPNRAMWEKGAIPEKPHGMRETTDRSKT